MSRSSMIYIVQEKKSGRILQAFTVKYEAVSFISLVTLMADYNVVFYSSGLKNVTKIVDGGEFYKENS